MDEDKAWHLPYLTSADELQLPLTLLTITGLSHFELEDMYDEGVHCCESLDEQLVHQPPEENIHGISDADSHCRVSITALISGSNALRQRLLKLKTDEIFCALMQSSLASFLSPSSIRFLVQEAKEREISKVGAPVYSSRQSKDYVWYFLASGKLRVQLDGSPQIDGDPTEHELNPGEFFGGYNANPE